MSGVKYIDLENNNFIESGSSVTIKGVYNAIKSTRKRIVLTNFSIEGVKSHDIEGSVTKENNGNYYIAYATEHLNLYFTIETNDQISLSRG